jgi:hypothetical protein
MSAPAQMYRNFESLLNGIGVNRGNLQRNLTMLVSHYDTGHYEVSVILGNFVP